MFPGAIRTPGLWRRSRDLAIQEATVARYVPTANHDFSLLLGMGLLRKVGRGRSTRYALGEGAPNRQGIVR
jgi:hypothetical protein